MSEAPVPEGRTIEAPSSPSARNEVDAASSEAVSTSPVSKEKTPEELAEAARRKRVGEIAKCEKTLGHMTEDEKYEFVEKYREAGNMFFREGDYTSARKTYQEAMTFIQHALHLGNKPGEDDSISLGGAPKALDERSAKLMILYISNSVACCLKERDYNKAIELCNKADKMNHNIPPSQKAKLCFRRGEALMGLEKIEEALEQYERALTLEPTDKGISVARDKCKQKVKVLHAKEHQAAKEIWGGKLAGQKSEEAAAPSESREDVEPVSGLESTTAPGSQSVQEQIREFMMMVIRMITHMLSRVFSFSKVSNSFIAKNADDEDVLRN